MQYISAQGQKDSRNTTHACGMGWELRGYLKNVGEMANTNMANDAIPVLAPAFAYCLSSDPLELEMAKETSP